MVVTAFDLEVGERQVESRQSVHGCGVVMKKGVGVEWNEIRTPKNAKVGKK